MMICPRCGAEYRQGFTSCADCHVLLVAEGTAAAASQQKAWSTWSSRSIHASDAGADMGNELDSTQDAVNVDTSVEGEEADANAETEAELRSGIGDPNTDPFCSFWRGADLRVCTEICTVLDESGIPHRTIRRQDHLFNLNNQTPYEIGVPASLYEKAENAIRDAFGSADEDHLQAGQRLLKEQSEVVNDLGIFSPCLKVAKGYAKAEVRERDEFGDESEESAPENPQKANFRGADEWHREDATRLVWEGEPAEAHEMTEMALKENDIRMRWETSDGKEKLYVLPEDEERAKEIVKEVVTGEPTGDDGSGKS